MVTSAMKEHEKLKKLTAVMKKAGAKICYPAGCLWYVVLDSDIPLKVRTMALAPLLYLISPVDGIPDFIPNIGFTDDAAIIAAAIGALAMHIKYKHRAKAKELVTDWFGLAASEKIDIGTANL